MRQQKSAMEIKQKFSQAGWLPPIWLRFLVIVVLALGIFFRFVNLDKKVYWHDEAITSLHLSGYKWPEVRERVFNGRVIEVKELQKYQYPNPERDLMDTINTLIVEDPQHPPIYYVMARLSVLLFGNSITAVRGVSALISLFVFPCIYWLCLELFNSSLIGWVSVALIAVSPVHVVFAQEARELSLWMVTTLLTSAALLRAIRQKTKLSWGIYAGTLILGLYSFPFVGLSAIGHGIYLIAIEGFRLSKTVKSYLLATLASLLAFAPWILVIFNSLRNAQASTAWSSTQVPLSKLLISWVGNPSRVFFDINLDAHSPFIYTITSVLIVLSLEIYSFYFLFYKTEKRAFLFILIMIVVPVLPLVLPDLILGGMRSTVPRYLIPCYLGILLAVANLIGNQIVSASVSQRKFWQGVMAMLITAGIVSCIVSYPAEAWWNKKSSENNPQVAKIINQTSRPLLISSDDGDHGGQMLSLSYLLAPKVQLQLVNEPRIPKIPNGFSDIFVYDPSETFKSGIEREYYSKIEPIEPISLRIWKLKNN